MHHGQGSKTVKVVKYRLAISKAGLPDNIVKQSKSRFKAAIQNIGYP